MKKKKKHKPNFKEEKRNAIKKENETRKLLLRSF
jgi:hypothetical protein